MSDDDTAIRLTSDEIVDIVIELQAVRATLAERDATITAQAELIDAVAAIVEADRVDWASLYTLFAHTGESTP